MAIAPKVVAFPSLVASVFLVQHILRSRKLRGRVYTRILLGMAAHDIIYSFKSFLTTWPIPSDIPFTFGNVGTTATCTAAGFLGHAGALTSAMYNASLTCYFLLAIVFGWKEGRTRRVAEPGLHLLPIAIGWGTAVATLPLDLQNPIGWTCWIGVSPPGCSDTTYPCTRGDPDLVTLTRWLFFHAELWAAFLFVMVAMIAIYAKIRRVEMKTVELSLLSDGKARVSRRFATQAALYVSAFVFAWIFAMGQTVSTQINNGTVHYPLILLSGVTTSLQGLFNAAIYLRPRVTKCYAERRKSRESHQKEWTQAAWKAVSASVDDDDSMLEGSDDPARIESEMNSCAFHPPKADTAVTEATPKQHRGQPSQMSTAWGYSGSP